MNKGLIKEKVERAVRKLIKDDSFLLASDVNERSTTHQLAVYLTDEFSDYDVDCEYNRMFREGRQVQKRSIRVEEMPTVSIGDLSAKTAYPDVIIHRREDDKHNLLIIEAKKSGSDTREDYRKLNGFMESKDDNGLGYEFSAFVIFNTSTPDEFLIDVKQNGETWSEAH